MHHNHTRLLFTLMIAGAVAVALILTSGNQSVSARPVIAGTLNDLGTFELQPNELRIGTINADISTCSQFTLFATTDLGDDADDYISVTGWLMTDGQHVFETPDGFADGNHTAAVGFTQQAIFTSDATAPQVSAVLFNHNEDPRDIHVSLWCEPY